MKKFFTSLCLALIAVFGFQANAEMYIIGEVSADGWNPSKGVAMTTTDDVNYTVDIDVTAIGTKYFCFTSKLGSSSSDWSGILNYRFGGSMQIPFDTETTLTTGTDKSPYCVFTEAGTYTFTINSSTKVCKVSKKSSIDIPDFNGTIYVSKNSTGFIWAWDAAGNYATNEWPGDSISTLSTTTVGSTEYYYLTYSHNSKSPGLIFSDGMSQTETITPVDGKVYTYVGGSDYVVTDPSTEPVTSDNVWILGEVNGVTEWSAYSGLKMNTTDNNIYTADVTTTGAMGGYSYFSFTRKLAEAADTANQGWDAINDYRFGSIALDDYEVTQDQLGSELALSPDGSAVAFKIPAGEYKFNLNLSARTLVITGTMVPKEETNELYILGEVNGNSWAPNVGVKMDSIAANTFKATAAFDGANEGYNYFSFTKKLASSATDWTSISGYRIGADASADFEITTELLGTGLALGADGSSTAFKIAEGKYDLVVNLETRQLTVTKAEDTLKGDVNGDGVVNTSDVSALLNIILGSAETVPAADVNGEGVVNTSDVTALINIILGA